MFVSTMMWLIAWKHFSASVKQLAAAGTPAVKKYFLQRTLSIVLFVRSILYNVLK